VPPPLIPQALGGFEVCLGAVLCASSTFSSDPANFVIGDGKVVPSTVPLPAALPLFATGLGALGLLGWRRKRKAA